MCSCCASHTINLLGDKMKSNTQLESVTIRFAGDSGDGMQLTGSQFTRASAIAGNDISTLPDFPAEIRAPAGTLYGVSGFQLQFSSEKIHTPGDEAEVLVAMNPAALKASLKYLKKNGTIVVNTDAFNKRNLRMAGYEQNPLDTHELDGYQVFPVEMSRLTRDALEDTDLSHKEKERSKNFFALGMLFWLYNRPLEPTLNWIEKKFAAQPVWLDANKSALMAGRNFADSTELFAVSYSVPHAEIEPGTYRQITGNEALSIGLVAASVKSGRQVFYGSYPITPASDILQYMAVHKNFGVKSFQAEDEMAAIGAAIGASFAGDLGVTATSGPGFALKSEFLGYALTVELPLVVINVQRAGPSTGMPTKPEQSDLLQTMFGRNGETYVPVVAAKSPADCFDTAFEAAKIAMEYMTPVVMLSDAYLANGAEPWKIPDTESLPELKAPGASEGDAYQPYLREDKTLARKWALPGTPGLEHRLGGLEKEDVTGNVSYDAENHHFMTKLRAEKIDRIRQSIETPEVYGDPDGDVLLISWGSTHGTVQTAVDRLRRHNKRVSFTHLRWINPLPPELGEIMKKFKKVLIPEINMGQLRMLIRSEFLVDAHGFNRVRGLPLSIEELMQAVDQLLEDNNGV